MSQSSAVPSSSPSSPRTGALPGPSGSGPHAAPPRPLLDYHAASTVLGVSIRTIYELVQTGNLRAVRVLRRVRFDPSDLEQFIANAKSVRRSAAREEVKRG